MAMSSIESAAISVSNGVGALTRSFDHHVEQVVDDVGVVARKADHRIGIKPAVEEVVVAGPRSADQQVVAGTASDFVVAGAAEDQVIAETARDLVVHAVLADDEVVHRGRRQIDAAAIAIARIGTADQVVIRPEQITGVGRAVEVDALDASLCIRSSEVAGDRDVLCYRRRAIQHGVADHKIAGCRAGVIVGGVQASQQAESRDRVDRREDRDAIRRPAAGRIDGFVDDVVPVTKAERIGVVAEAAVQGIHGCHGDRQVVDANDVVCTAVVGAAHNEAYGCVRGERSRQRDGGRAAAGARR